MPHDRTLEEMMTPLAYSIGDDQSVVEALLRMKELEVRHLPVMRGSKLVGIVSHRDLAVLEAISEAHPADLRVTDAMTPDPYTASPSEKVEPVAREMAKKRYGAVLVVDEGQVKGIFTTTDALWMLAEVLASERD